MKRDEKNGAERPPGLPFRLIGIVQDQESLRYAVEMASVYPNVGLGLMLRDPEHRPESVRRLAAAAMQETLPDNMALISNGCSVEGIQWRHLTGRELAESLEKGSGQEFLSLSHFGCSVHSFGELPAVQRLHPAYILLSPIFATSSKPEAVPLEIVGLKAFRAATSIPVIALGGITSVTQVEACLKAGASGIAGISLLRPERRGALHEIMKRLSESPTTITR